ncbi:MAG: methyltransferase domain-containing protein [Rhodoferax sp.]
MSSDHPPTLDPVAALRWSRRVPGASPWLHEEVARRMEERLQWIRSVPARWAHWEPLQGGLGIHAALVQRYPQAQCVIVEPEPARRAVAERALRPPWWQPARWAGARTQWELPAPGSVQMVWSNMALHIAPDPQAVLAQWHQALAPDGFLMFSCLGPDTLRTLQTLWLEAGWPAPAHAFTDMHDWGDMLVRAGFAEPVMDMEHITLTFPSAERLLRELRELGRNLHVGRFAGLRGRQWQGRMLAALARLASPEGGELALGFEVNYGHALKPPPRATVLPETRVPLGDMRQALRGARGLPKGAQ